MTSLYETLGIPANASPADIKKAYRNLAKQHHPDKGGSDEAFRAIAAAYLVLSNPDQRKLYDQYGVSTPADEWIALVTDTLTGLLYRAFEVARDPIANTREHIERELREARTAHAHINSNLQRIATKLKKLQRKSPGKNLLYQSLSEFLAKEQQTSNRQSYQIAIGEAMLELLSDYTFTEDPFISSRPAKS